MRGGKILFSNWAMNFYVNLLQAPDNPVPDHEEVESNEEPQHSSYIRHQGEGGVGLNLLQNLDLVTDERWTKYSVGTSCHCGIFYQLRYKI